MGRTPGYFGSKAESTKSIKQGPFAKEELALNLEGVQSLVLQDLVLLSDFISLPRLIKILCKGRVSFENYQHNTELLSVPEIERVLTRIGKNHL